ncbi:MAG TPA: hypothetical protein DHV28_06255 [Ignavibacteriales bacterium]|nr:hypothetical protein [Ignavibacteriales bacterium]
MAKNKKEINFNFSVPVYWMNPVSETFNSSFAKALRKGLPIELEIYIINKEIDAEEVVKVANNKGEITYWLVKNEILSGINKKENRCLVKTTSVRKVEIEKEHPDKKGYVILKSDYKKL